MNRINLSRFFVINVLLLATSMPAQSASFDCAKAQSKVEHLVCETPLISTLDETLAKDYQDVLSKANEEQKHQVKKDQRHWLSRTRNACRTVTCLKHAYWSRQAVLEAYFEPRSPLYQKESDKAEDIKRVLANSSLYYRAGTDKGLNQFCTQMFDDLKEMKGVRFLDPVAQTQSYEDPALDPWKVSCQSAPPFNYSSSCQRNILPADADDAVQACSASYGVPPFKIYELPPESNSGEKRYFFYHDETYGPMNWSHIKPHIGGGGGFNQIHIDQCLRTGGNYWIHGGKLESNWRGLSAEAGRGDRNGKNYNSIIRYHDRYYFVLLHQSRPHSQYRLDVLPADNRNIACRWTSVKH